jgi:hypothetical protein
VTILHPDGETVRISKANPEQANFTVEAIPEDRSLLYDSVANVIAGVLQNLTLEDVERTGNGSGDETVIELTTFDGLVLTVHGLEREDGTWIRFAASAVPEPQDQAAEADAIDPTAEAQELNARLGGWRFRIPAYKFEQLTRRMDDLLQAQT